MPYCHASTFLSKLFRKKSLMDVTKIKSSCLSTSNIKSFKFFSENVEKLNFILHEWLRRFKALKILYVDCKYSYFLCTSKMLISLTPPNPPPHAQFPVHSFFSLYCFPPSLITLFRRFVNKH